MSFLSRERVCLAQLRASLPNWKWKAYHNNSGLGWHYLGTKGNRTVDVRAYAVTCGPSSDDYTTEWRINEDDYSDTLWHFIATENVMEGFFLPTDVLTALNANRKVSG